MANAPPGGAGGAPTQTPSSGPGMYQKGWQPGGATAAPPIQNTPTPNLGNYGGLYGTGGGGGSGTVVVPGWDERVKPGEGMNTPLPNPVGPAPIAGENPYPSPQVSTPMQPYPGLESTQPSAPFPSAPIAGELPPSPPVSGPPQTSAPYPQAMGPAPQQQPQPRPQPQFQPQQPFNPINNPGYMALMQQLAQQRSMGGDPMNGLQGMYGRMENPGMTAQQMRFGMPHAIPPTATPNGETSPAPQISDQFSKPNFEGAETKSGGFPPKMAANLSRMMGAGGPPDWMMSRVPEANSDRKIAGNPNATPIGRRMGRAKGGNE